MTGQMKLLILSVLVATSIAAPAAQSLTFHDDGSYRFYYETGKEGGSHSRSEVRNADGSVIGKFSYEDPDGDMREVNYKADNSGFIAQGDVGVKGAPKGQFPVAQEDQPQQSTSLTVATLDNAPAEPKQEEAQKQQRSEQQVEATHDYHDEEADKDEMQDLALEESSANDPPEAFPPGFFLAKFQGLRRLPEPTKEPKPSTTEAPKATEIPVQSEKPKPEKVQEEKKEPTATEFSASGVKPLPGSSIIAPFHGPGLSHQEWSSAMFHQPVYVFAYNQPDSYGYHYFF